MQKKSRGRPKKVLPTLQIIAAYEAGHDLRAIASYHHVSHMTIKRLLVNAEYDLRPPRCLENLRQFQS